MSETRGVLTTQCSTIHRKPREIPGKYYSHVIACLSPWFIWYFIPKAAINTQNMLFYLYTRLPTKDNRNIRNSWDLLNRATSEHPVTLFTFLCENSSKNRVYWIWLRGSASYVIIIIITTDYIFRNNVIWEVHGVQQLSCYFVTTAAQAKRTVSLTVGKQGWKAHFIPSVSTQVKIKIVLIEKNRFILHYTIYPGTIG